MLKHDKDFGQVQVMEFHGICQENDGISIGFCLIFDQTVVKKTWDRPYHIFYRDNIEYQIDFPWTYFLLSYQTYGENLTTIKVGLDVVFHIKRNHKGLNITISTVLLTFKY